MDETDGHDTTRPSARIIGQNAEESAARYLEAQGMSVVARNFRCRGGEIDLVCRDGKALVFVEVRRRTRADFGGAGPSITVKKQERIALAANYYLLLHASAASDCRFDCVLIDGQDEGEVEWIRDAFAAP